MKGVFLVSAFASAILIAEGSAFANPCDETLSPSPTSGPDGYVERAGGERCEGMYVSPVSGTPVELVSLTRGQLSYDAAHAIVVRVSLDAAPSNGGAHLRAVGIPDGLYYRWTPTWWATAPSDGRSVTFSSDAESRQTRSASTPSARIRALNPCFFPSTWRLPALLLHTNSRLSRCCALST